MSPIRATERERYPADWPAVRARILTRAEGRCEFPKADGSRCNAPDLEQVARMVEDLEQWHKADEAINGLPNSLYRLVKVVLTIAHLNHEPEDNRDTNLRCACQLHHLRHDAEQHQANAAATRRAKKNNGDLFSEAGS